MTPTDSQAARLLPCPFCGNDVNDDEGCFPCSPKYWEVRCGNPACFAHDPVRSTREEAITVWNTRPREQAGEVDEWRPIETAPQGVMILLADMTATEARHWTFVGWKHHWNKDGHVETPSAINRRATHWKHLPQPPALAAALGRENG